MSTKLVITAYTPVGVFKSAPAEVSDEAIEGIIKQMEQNSSTKPLVLIDYTDSVVIPASVRKNSVIKVTTGDL